MKNFRRLIMVLLVLMVSMLIGCTTTQPKKQVYSGFLNDYPVFTKGAEAVDLRYLAPGVDFKKYKKVMMDEVVFFFNTDSDYHGIHPSEIQELSEKFYSIYIKALGDILTDSPGPDVVRMRLAVTDIEPSNPVSGAMTTVVPVGLAVSLIKKGVTGEYTGIGSASAEVEFLDSLTNERLAVGIDKAPGGKLDVGELSPVESAFEYWAGRLAAFMKSLKE